MKSPRLMARLLSLFGFFLLPTISGFTNDKPKAKSDDAVLARDLEEVQQVTLEFLTSVTSVSISQDGKFLYAAAFGSNSVSGFKRDTTTGLIESDTWMETPELGAAVSVQLSPDNQFAAVAAFGANAVSLFKREDKTGELVSLDSAINGKDGNSGLNFAIDAMFSSDSRFLYSASSTGVGVFRLENGKLVFVQEATAEGKLRGVRGIGISPNGTTLYAAAYESGTVGVFTRSKESGKLTLVQLLADGEDGNDQLAGAFRIACSQDGKHVYISSGRFQGDQAISVFATQPDGKLKLIEEHVNGIGDFTGFDGGNSIVISPDGTLVYAVASNSDRLVRFRRDPETGKLKFLGSQIVGPHNESGAAGLCFSPDGKFVYVADESSNSIVIFKQP